MFTIVPAAVRCADSLNFPTDSDNSADGGSAGRQERSPRAPVYIQRRCFDVWRRRELASIKLAASSVLIHALMMENSLLKLNRIEEASGETALARCNCNHGKVCFQSPLIIDPQQPKLDTMLERGFASKGEKSHAGD